MVWTAPVNRRVAPALLLKPGRHSECPMLKLPTCSSKRPLYPEASAPPAQAGACQTAAWPYPSCLGVCLRQPPHMLAEIARHAGNVPAHVAEIPVAGALRVVHNLYAGVEHHFPARVPKPGADVDILVVEVKPLVEASYCLECLGTEQHEHAGRPVDRNRRAGSDFVAGVIAADQLSQQPGRGREAAGVAVVYAEGIDRHGRHQSDLRVIHAVQQGGKRVVRQTQVGVRDAEEWGVGLLEGSVVIGAKSFGSWIDNLPGIKSFWRQEQGLLGKVVRDDDVCFTRMVSKVIQNEPKKVVLIMANNGDCDAVQGCGVKSFSGLLNKPFHEMSPDSILEISNSGL